uniref:Uncharacterized protein n=1 Tax=Knipowitschia caucasica TaxID=637954 RepID=A0AAV2JKP8_KNICA
MNARSSDTEARKENEVRWVWRSQEIRDLWDHQDPLASPLMAPRDPQGPVELLERVTPVTACFHPYEPSSS